MKNVFFIFKVLFKQTPLWVLITVALTVASSVIVPFILTAKSNMITEVVFFVNGGLFNVMFNAVLIFAILQILQAVLKYVSKITKGKTYERIAIKFDTELFEKESNLEFEHFESGTVARIKEKIRSPKDTIYNAYNDILGIGGNLIKIAGYFVFFCAINIYLIFPFLLFFIIASIMGYRNRQRDMKIFWGNATARVYLNNVESVLSNTYYQKDIRSMQSKDYLLDKRNVYLKDINSKMLKKIKQDNLEGGIVIFFEICITFLVLILGTLGFIKGNISLGILTVSLSSILGLLSSITSVGKTSAMFATLSEEIKYYKEYMELSERTIGTKKLGRNYDIEFKNVCFTYPNTNKEILHNLNFKINSKSNLAFVGENGSGKTTIIKLLAGLYKPTSGQILVGGIDIAELSNEARFELFGFVFQQRESYSLKLRENVAIGDVRKVDNDKVLISAMKQANCESIFKKCNNDLDTVIGWRNKQGISFSGGERQRLQTSRIFVSPHKFYILDEPVASLDAQAECKMYENFLRLFKNKGVIVISHRLASAKLADNIFMFKNGRLVARGTHNELLKTHKPYERMFTLQAKQYKLSERSNTDED